MEFGTVFETVAASLLLLFCAKFYRCIVAFSDSKRKHVYDALLFRTTTFVVIPVAMD